MTGRKTMPIIEYQGRKIEVDDEGYLKNFDDWDETVACALAEKEDVLKSCPLGPEQLEILKFIRDHYKKFNAVPIVRAVCTNVHQPKACEYLQFPTPIITAKIAGLPKLETGYDLM
jgi:TusE/DsrC/DsvC family sulfur relay protein